MLCVSVSPHGFAGHVHIACLSSMKENFSDECLGSGYDEGRSELR